MKIAADFLDHADQLQTIESAFEQSTQIIKENRNVIKLVELADKRFVIKSFKQPNFIQGAIYAGLRKTKARRSYEYSEHLLQLGIDTPKPVAYIEHFSGARLQKSYYISEYYNYDLLLEEVFEQDANADSACLEKFVEFTFFIHQQGVLHLDFNPCNVMIRQTSEGYHFAICDLNRMRFKRVSLEEGLANLVRLTANQVLLEKIARLYADCAEADSDWCVNRVMAMKNKYDNRYHLRQKLKRLFK